MRSINSGRLAATASLFALAAAFAPGAALAQDTPAPEATEQADPNANSGDAATAAEQPAADSTQASEGTIVVTGSRLRRDERNSPDPVTIIDPSMENREGKLGLNEVLQSSPLAAGSTQITSTISSNFVVNGGEGVQTISLRGLGANRTLVLLNGRRAGPAGVRGGVSAFDLNVIPVDAIQTIDILKTGASSIYGSDAVAGVVNVITKKDLRGFEVRGFVSAPTHGGGEQYSLSATYGLPLGDRGNIMLGANWYHHKELERGDRSFLGCEEEFVTNEATGNRSDPIDPRTGEPYCGAFPNAQIFLTDFFGAPNLCGPAVPINPNTVNPPCGPVAPGSTRRRITSIQFNYPGSRLDEFLNPLAAPVSFADLQAPAGFFPVGAYNATGLAMARNYDSQVDGDSVIPDTRRFTLFGELGYELSDRVDLYVEGLYNQRKTKTDGSRQLFFYQFAGDSVVGLPYYFCAGGYYAEGEQCDPFAAGDPLNSGFTFPGLLQPVIKAPASSSTDVKYFRGVVGLRANLDNVLPNGFADFHLQYSRSDGDYKRDIIFRDSIEFGVAEWRTDLCEGTQTAIRGADCIDINYTDPRVLMGDFTAEERAFLFGVDKGNTLYKQFSGEVTVGGDVFELPAGPVKVAIGLHARKDSINDVPGEATQTGNLWASTSSGITKGYQNTKEAFGEVEVPVFENSSIGKSLTLSAAARVTNTYAKRTGPVCTAPGVCEFDGAEDSDKGNWTYKLAANWQTTDWLRLRGTYGTSFRSPALFEQFLANESGFIAQSADPCVRWELSESQEIRDNCAAAGVPINHTGGGSFESFSTGGIGLLDPETSKAWTVSAIFTPQGWFWNGGKFSLTVDYIDIKVKDEVTQLGSANILNGCYTSDSFPDDPLCDLFVRDDQGQNASFDIVSLNDPFLNIDTQHNKSLDFTLRFRQDMGSMGTLSLLGQTTYQLSDKFVLFQGTEGNFNGEAGDPKWVTDINLTWAKAPFTITYGLQVIAATNDIDNLEDVGGTALTAGNCLGTDAAYALRGGPYCPVYKLPRVAYHSLSAEIEAAKGFTFLVGVSNIFDKKPPLVSTVGAPIAAFAQVPLLGSYYDYYGRRLFVSAKAKL
ncbi:TonB-dependent receptor [Sphingomonas sp. RB56-2]|uniref:TonB-dependent receptor n=1 Tax=Sphingomonas brevis TaxID=2908206 RepID=A0ABT0S701_9SPHN|nr:TonB-dependent receptor [Sphingomonas brevis]MCL6740183.1 TonB-dependent receptor [Sphingomonas brevis]